MLCPICAYSGTSGSPFYDIKNAVFNGEQEKIYNHECQYGIEKFVSIITVCHHRVCRVMTNGDREGLTFLSHNQYK